MLRELLVSLHHPPGIMRSLYTCLDSAEPLPKLFPCLSNPLSSSMVALDLSLRMPSTQPTPEFAVPCRGMEDFICRRTRA